MLDHQAMADAATIMTTARRDTRDDAFIGNWHYRRRKTKRKHVKEVQQNRDVKRYRLLISMVKNWSAGKDKISKVHD